MKISEFAQKNQVSTKLLRHYDEMGLLKPAAVDPENGYRCYCEDQSHLLNWILILKNLDFSLTEIKNLLESDWDQRQLTGKLISKRIQISQTYNEQILKRIQIDRLIQLIELEGFSMEKKINLLEMTESGIREIKKYMPNTEMFLEDAEGILENADKALDYCVLRLDLCQFKEVNDVNGFEVGDKVIVAFYQAIMDAIAVLKPNIAYGRAGGDEFTVLILGNPDLFQKVGQQIVHYMSTTDFKALGCFKQVEVYVSGLWSTVENAKGLRALIEETHETLIQAKRVQNNHVLIKAFSAQ